MTRSAAALSCHSIGLPVRAAVGTKASSLASLRGLAAHGPLPGSLNRAGGPAPPVQLAPLPLRLGHGCLVASVALLPSAYPARFASRQAYASARDVNNRYPAIALSTIASGSPCIAFRLAMHRHWW